MRIVLSRLVKFPICLTCSHNQISQAITDKICVFRWSIFKCATFLAVDLFGCQSLSYNKLEQFPKTRNCNLWLPRTVSYQGLCLYLQERLPRSCYSLPCRARAFTTVIKIWKHYKWQNVTALFNSKECRKNRLDSLYQYSQKKKKIIEPGLCVLNTT